MYTWSCLSLSLKENFPKFQLKMLCLTFNKSYYKTHKSFKWQCFCKNNNSYQNTLFFNQNFNDLLLETLGWIDFCQQKLISNNKEMSLSLQKYAVSERINVQVNLNLVQSSSLWICKNSRGSEKNGVWNLQSLIVPENAYQTCFIETQLQIYAYSRLHSCYDMRYVSKITSLANDENKAACHYQYAV